VKVFVAAILLLIPAALNAQAPAATAHAPDGGVQQRLESILIPPLAGAPFSATITTEWTHLMPDGTMATVKNHRTVARDSSGRIFEERRFFSPDGDKQVTRISNLQYIDPHRHEYLNCIPEQKTCYESPYMRQAMTKMPDGAGGKQACTCGGGPLAGASVKQEPLGQKTMEDVEVIGSREITTIAKGAIGNDQPEPIVKEFWYSPRLGINLVTKRFDPRSGIANFQAGNLSLSEPDTRLFQPPGDYKIVQMVAPPGMR
jgi:hypothetical protein